MKAPFPYFGGKATIADLVWQYLGEVKTYIEPFFGSGAVLLNRPDYDQTKHKEIVNDKDGYIANVWRALQFAPDEVAKVCDWPVNHADLSARKKRLIRDEALLLENLIADEKWYHAELAGYWIWATSCWIGSGLTCIGQRPDVSDSGVGVHRIGKIPDVSDSGKGVHRIGQIPNIGNSGKGVHRIGQRPDVGNSGKGVQDPYNTNLYTWFRELSERLRYVKVVCGDWTRVCGGNWQNSMSPVGIFFDPPYGVETRDTSLYHHDSIDVAQEVRQWCIERGKLADYRIVLAGYDEHEELLQHGWTQYNYSVRGGYSSGAKKTMQGKENRHRECLYMSPYCVGKEKDIFD